VLGNLEQSKVEERVIVVSLRLPMSERLEIPRLIYLTKSEEEPVEEMTSRGSANGALPV
jgi:hypothetical protein